MRCVGVRVGKTDGGIWERSAEGCWQVASQRNGEVEGASEGRGRRVNGASNTRKEGKQGSGQGAAVTGLPCILSLVRALTRHAVDVCA